MRQHRFAPSLVLFATSALVACSGIETTGPRINDLVLSFYVVPDTAHAGDLLTALFRIQNPTGDSVVLETGDACLARLAVFYSDGRKVPFVDATQSCADSATTVTIGAAQTGEWQWGLTVLDSFAVAYRAPPFPGRYTARLTTIAPLPDLEAPFDVWPSGYWWGWTWCEEAVSPFSHDTVVVAVDSTSRLVGGLRAWYKVRNLTTSAIALRESVARGTDRSRGEILMHLEMQTPGGWETVSSPIIFWAVYDVPVHPRQCVQTVTGVTSADAGTFRLAVTVGSSSHAYSDPFAVP